MNIITGVKRIMNNPFNQPDFQITVSYLCSYILAISSVVALVGEAIKAEPESLLLSMDVVIESVGY